MSDTTEPVEDQTAAAAAPVVAPTEGTAPAPVVAPGTEGYVAPVEPVEPAPDQSFVNSSTALSAGDLTVPEGLDISDENMAEFLGVLNNSELSPSELANALLGAYQTNMSSAMEALSAQQDEALQTTWTDTKTEWRTAIQNDPVIGGINLPTTQAQIAAVLDNFGTQELRQAFDLTGAGDHPEVVKFLAKIGASMMESQPVNGTPTNAPKSAADRMYGNSAV